MLRTLAIIAAITASANATATSTSIDWDLQSSNITTDGTWVAGSNSSTWNDAESIALTSDGVEVVVTGWSDSEGDTSASNNKEYYDQIVEQGDLYYWGDSNGWGVVNGDENSNSVPDHSIDNYSSSLMYSDQDMVLLSFSEAVSLEGISVGWYSDGQNNILDVGAVAISSQDVANMSNGTSTWDDIYSEVDMSTISKQGSSNYYALDSDAGSSTFWLVGLYNEMENCDYDAFKLMGVTAKTSNGGGGTPPVDVPEPSSIAIFALGLAFIVRQKKLSSKFKLNF